MLGAACESIARDLVEYGEHDAADWVRSCSDDDLVRICSVADWLLFNGPSTKTGSMMIAQALALAAVYVREGTPRDLVRSRRKPLPPLSEPERDAIRRGRWVNYQVQEIKPRDYGVGQDARDYWGQKAR
jgi:hypothetical protein